MADIIQLLPDSIANQIAAGEVIQRPASAVKELLENSVDAGATHVKLILKDAGKTLIQVVDNGCGMSETDARMSFERHATSKLKKAEDLFAIRTKGFRGEALASVAAIAQVELKSRLTGKELGTQIEIEGSEIVAQEVCSCQEGTAISVKNLFFNVPARRNFLKSNSVEIRHIIDEFQRVALAHPETEFSLFHNNTQMYSLPRSNLRQRIVAIFGNNYNDKLVPAKEETDIFKIGGFVGKPEYARKSRGEQFFFVNNRFIRDAYLNHAVLNAYEDLIPAKSYPLYVLFIEIDPKHIDVNVHPTKQEIKFDDDRLVYAMVRSAVKHALGQYNITPSLDFEQEQAFSHSHGSSGGAYTETASKKDYYMPPGKDTPELEKINREHWEKLYRSAKDDAEEGPISGNGAGQAVIHSDWEDDEAQQDNSKEPYQIHNRFILTHIKSGIIIIDQQAAHERVLYERYIQTLATNRLNSQRLLFPQTVELSAGDFELIKSLLEDIRKLGFDIEDFGKNTLVIHGVPADILTVDESQILEQVLEQFKCNDEDFKLEKRKNLALSLAKQSGIKAGKTLAVNEMQVLLDELFACENPNVSPSGKTILVNLSLEKLLELFNS